MHPSPGLIPTPNCQRLIDQARRPGPVTSSRVLPRIPSRIKPSVSWLRAGSSQRAFVISSCSIFTSNGRKRSLSMSVIVSPR